MTAANAAEIREASRAHLDEVLRSSELSAGGWVYDLTSPLRYTPPDDDGPAPRHLSPGLWDDLRPSQQARLDALIEDIYTKADVLMAEVAERVVDYVVEAGLQFAAEYPDAPRKPQLIPA